MSRPDGARRPSASSKDPHLAPSGAGSPPTAANGDEPADGCAATMRLPDGLSPEETFEHWRLAVASIFEARPAEADYRERFRGRLVTHNAGRFLIGTSHSGPLRTRRDEGLIGTVGVDHLLFQLYAAGHGEFDAERRQGRVEAGDLVCFDLSRRHAAALSTLDTVSIVVPRALIHHSPRVIDQAHGAVIKGGTAVGMLLGQQLSALAQASSRISASDLEPLASVASSLVSVGVSLAARGRVDDPGAMLALTLREIRAHIEANLGNADLSIDAIGRHFGLSRSALYRIFEPIGGIAEYIRDRRLDRAALHVGSVGSSRGAVARLMVLCGFSSEAAFSRAFRGRYGISPRDAILQAQLRLDGAVSQNLAEHERNWIRIWLGELSAARSGPGRR